MHKLEQTLNGTSKRPRPDSSTPVEKVRPSERPMDSSGPGTYKEALANTQVGIFKEYYPEDKMTEDDQDHILEELGRVFRGTPKGELPHLRSFRLEGSALLYVCPDQQSGQWLIRYTDNHRLQSGIRLKPTEARNFPKTVNMALRTKDKVAKSSDELPKWIKDLSPGLHKERWMVLDRQPEPKGRRLILLIDWGSLKTIKGMGYKIFTGLTQGIVKVLRDPEEAPKQEEGATTNPAPSGSVSEGEQTVTSTPSGTKITEWRKATEMVGEIPPTLKPAPVSHGPPSEGTWSAEKGDREEVGLETDPPPNITTKTA
jgi:hypothetical protein